VRIKTADMESEVRLQCINTVRGAVSRYKATSTAICSPNETHRPD
jgi:hypothetical protein